MKILFISPQNPYYNGSGAHQRSYMLLSSLVGMGASVDVIFVDRRFEKEDELLLKTTNILQVFNFRKTKADNIKYKLRYLAGFGTKLKRRCLYDAVMSAISTKQYDYVFCRYVDVVQESGISTLNNLIVDIDDSPYEVYNVRYQNTKNILLKAWYYVASVNAARYMNRYECNFKISYYPQEKQCIKPNAVFLPNIPLLNSSYKLDENIVGKDKNLLYVGVLSWMPNYLGLDHFLMHVWPQVVSDHPDASITIVGKGLSDSYRTKWESIKGVRLMGFVEDLLECYRKARAVVVPIYQGGGTNIKVLEALGYGKATCMSLHATRGFESYLKNKENCMISDNDSMFANNINRVLSDDALCVKLQIEGPKVIADNFSKNRFFEIVNESILSL